MLGLSISNFTEISSEPLNIESDNDNEFEEEAPQDDADDAILSSNDSSHVNNYNNELVQKDNTVSPLKNIDEFQSESGDVNIVKRPFLKRGSGLTQRFRIPPDAFNLKKLPRYKYADRVKMNLASRNRIKVKDPPKEAELPKKKPEAVKIKSPATIFDPSQQESTELIPPTNVALKIPKQTLPTAEPEPQIQEWFNSRTKDKQPVLDETPKVAKLPKGVSWAQILSSNNIMDSPFKIDHLLNPTNLDEDSEMNETSLFHLLEERVHNMNVDTSFTSIMKLVATLQNPKSAQDEDETLVNPNDPIIDDASTVNLQLQPHPTDVNKKIIIDETSDDECDEEGEDEHRVRFSENIEVVDYGTDLSTDIGAIELSPTSTPNERQKFQDFKRKLMGGHRKTEVRDELKEKSEMLKVKLAELEDEMMSLRQQNANVLKARQELDLDRLQFENDRDDMMEQMKDDRIRMELQLHDERLKLEQEKQKFEKMMKTPSKKEREEIAKLKEVVSELKEELQTKEVRHGSASARYRTQIKQLEKENQSLKLELEVVKRENKKLEVENARLRKDTNNKMLQEINRNIAKLAPTEFSRKKTEPTKKPTSRSSDPTLKKRVKSVPNLHVQSSSDSSEDEPVTSRKSSKENNPISVRRSDPVKLAPTKSSSDVLSDMKREIVNSDGSRDIWYPNGNLKKISPDGMLIRMLYFNKDIKETNMNEGTVKYYYNETNTWHTTYIDGLEILEYPE